MEGYVTIRELMLYRKWLVLLAVVGMLSYVAAGIFLPHFTTTERVVWFLLPVLAGIVPAIRITLEEYDRTKK